MRTGDLIKHRPSDEEWVVAFVKDEQVANCGWPLSFVDEAECEVIGAASDADEDTLLIQMAQMSSEEDPRTIYAKDVLKQRVARAVELSQKHTGEYFRHVKTGKYYRILCVAVRECNLRADVVYLTSDIHHPRSENIIWTRPADEFFDGRFISIEA